MILGDCLDVMPTLSHQAIDLACLDLPYGVTGFAWDVPLSLPDLMRNMSRGGKPKHPVVSFGNEPFHLACVDAWRNHYRYSLIWDKGAPCNFLQAAKRPLVAHEFIGIYGPTPVYNAQKTYGHTPIKKTGGNRSGDFILGYSDRQAGQRKDLDDSRNPLSILSFRRDQRVRYRPSDPSCQKTHPSQKPMALIQWLMLTYTNPGGLIVDPTSGSGTASVAAMLSDRSSISCEANVDYFDASVDRVMQTAKRNLIDVKIEVIT